MSALSGTLGFLKPHLSNPARALAEGVAPKISSCTTSRERKSEGFRKSLAPNSPSNKAKATDATSKLTFNKIFVNFIVRGLKIRSIEFEFRAPITLFGKLGLRFFVEHIIPQDQKIHLCSHKTSIGIVGCAYDRLAANVKACVYDHSISSELLELLD